MKVIKFQLKKTKRGVRHVKKIMVLLPFETRDKTRLAEVSGGMDPYYPSDVTSISEETLSCTEIIFGNPSQSVLSRCPALKWVQLASAGADAYVRKGVLPPGVQLTNATGAYGHAIAEHMIGMVFLFYKKLHLYRDNQHKGLWHDEGMVKSIRGTTVLVVGMGDIGGQFAERMKLLGAHVIGIRRTKRSKPDYADAVYEMEALDEVLPQADIVALSLPNTEKTVSLFNARRIAKMKPGAILLNVGRGNVVDTQALCQALSAGKLGGAGLDVTDPEPLPPDHPLWNVKNALITPHVAGGYHLRETYENIVSICFDNLKRYLNGRVLMNPVDFKTGYKKTEL